MLRRKFLKNSTAMSALLAAGCGLEKPEITRGLPINSVDIHTHIFNGRDIPITGFLTQVALRDTGNPPGNSPYSGLINLIKEIALSSTPFAKDELAAMKENKTQHYLALEGELLKQDERNVAKGINRFEQLVMNQNKSSDLFTNEQQQSNRGMLKKLYDLIGSDVERIATEKSRRNNAGAIAARIYQTDVSPLKRLMNQNTSLFQTLRWAGLLTRDRRGILSRLIDLYGKLVDDGKTQEIQIFSPSIVDFEYWLIEDESFSPIRDQVQVMSEIARRETRVVLLNFVAFCPLRATLDKRKGLDPLGLVKMAVSKQYGFAGVKLYPPMGFKPIGNDPNKAYGKKPGYMVNGKKLDTELRRLYSWCIDNDVPIKTHGNNSIEADVNTGCNASPEYWGKVLAIPAFAALRVNAAHFGGFDETRPNSTDCPDNDDNIRDWEEIAANLTDRHSGYYVDLGYWNDVLRNKGKSYDEILGKVRNLLRVHSNLENQILYGSDWSMIGRLVGHQHYLGDVKSAIKELGLKEEKIMSKNALRYLGLDHKGKQWRRLSKFFGPRHKFAEIFSELR